MTTVDANGYLHNLDIWPTPIKKPDSGFLGINCTEIEPSQIPFDVSQLDEFRFIENEFGEVLYYRNGKYVLFTNDPTKYLAHWFSKWSISKQHTGEPHVTDEKQIVITIHDGQVTNVHTNFQCSYQLIEDGDVTDILEPDLIELNKEIFI